MTQQRHGWRFDNALLRHKRDEARRTRDQVAAEIGVTKITIRWWETGRYVPEAMRLPVVAKAYGCSIDELFVPIPE